MFDGKAFGEDMTVIVRGYVDRAVAPLIAENKALTDRIAKLEGLAPLKGEAGKHGADGTSVDPTEVDRMVSTAVAKAVAGLPNPPPGKDGKDGADGADGMAVEPTVVADMVAAAVAKAIAVLPAPAPGKDGKDGTDGLDGKDGKGLDGKDGKDGAGIGDLLIDRAGSLVATFTDGRVKSLGVIVGTDGKDGEPGAKGADGLSLQDFEAKVMDDGRTIRFAMTAGETQHAYELSFPVVIDRGVYKDGATYAAGDGVTWAGSYWIAQKETTSKPDSGDGFRLAVKRGRDGKDLTNRA